MLIGLLITAIAIAAGAFLFFRHFEVLLAKQAEILLEKLLPGMQVSIASGRWWPGREIELCDIHVSSPVSETPLPVPALLARVSRIRLKVAGSLRQWIRDGLQVELVILEGLEFRAVRNRAGRWNWGAICQGEQGPGSVPRIQLEAATLIVEDHMAPRSTKFVVPIPRATLVYELQEGALSREQSASQSSQKPLGRWRVRALCEPPGLGEATVEAFYALATHQWQIVFQFHRINLTRELISQLPLVVHEELPDFRILGGELRLNAEVGGAAEECPNPQFQVTGTVEGVRVAIAHLDMPITDLSAKFRITSSQISIEGLQAAWGPATIFLPKLELCQQEPTGILQGEVAIDNLRINQEVVQIHPRLRQWYETYNPQGVLSLRGNFRFDAHGWRWNLRIFPQQMNLVYSRLPYPVREVSGLLEWTNEHLWAQLWGKVGNRPLTIQGRTLLREGAWQWIVAAPSVMFDREMVEALGGEMSRRLAELQPAGDFGFRFVSFRKAHDAAPERQLEIELQGTQVQYQRFPYPLRNLQGRLRMWGNAHGEVWELEETRAYENVAEIYLRGRLESWSGRHFLQLHFRAKDLPLDEQLRASLPTAAARKLWRDLALRGSLAELTGQVLYDSLTNRIHLRFSAEPAPEECSIQPSWFPYRIDNLAGRLEYHDGQAIIPQLRGQHGSARISATVACLQDAAGTWTVDLADFFAEQIALDQELAQAAPLPLRQVLRALNPMGRINVRGQIRIQAGSDDSSSARTQWALFVDTHQARLDCGLRFTGVSGTTQVVGATEGDRFACLTILDLTAANTQGVQLTQIRGPIWTDGQRILLGRPAPAEVPSDLWRAHVPLGGHISPGQSGLTPPRAPSSAPVTARMAGGLVSLDGVIQLGEASSFRLGFSVNRADLGQLAQELLRQPEDLRGLVYAQGEVRGILSQPDTLSGQGVLQLREADIYDTPLMLALLRMVTNREPKRNAFSSVDLSFEFEGQRIVIPYVVFQGPALNFEGSGEVDWQGRIRLLLRANLVRVDSPFPLVRQMVGDASQQLVLLHVSGWLYDPVVTSEPLPGVNHMLRGLQQEIGPQPSPGGPPVGPISRLPRFRSLSR